MLKAEEGLVEGAVAGVKHITRKDPGASGR